MKKIILVVSFFVALITKVNSQTLKQIKLSDLSIDVYMFLREYNAECVREHYFFEDKGIVEVVNFTDSLGRNTYRLTAMIDDRYLDELPNKYLKDMDMVFLFYSGDSNGNKIAIPHSVELANELKAMIEDRVYARPTKQKRMIEVMGIDGKTRKRVAGRIYGGIGWNSTLYIFDEPTQKYIVLKGV